MHYIYVYVAKEVPIYTGESENILKRNRQHYENSVWHNKSEFIYFAPVFYKEVAERYESYLIHKYEETLFNVQHPDLWKYYDNLPEQLRKLKWYKINLDEINNIENKSDALKYYFDCYNKKKPYSDFIWDMCKKY